MALEQRRAALARVKYWTWVGITDHQRAPIARASAAARVGQRQREDAAGREQLARSGRAPRPGRGRCSITSPSTTASKRAGGQVGRRTGRRCARRARAARARSAEANVARLDARRVSQPRSRASASRKPTQQPRSSSAAAARTCALDPLEQRRARSRAGRPPPRRSRRTRPRRRPRRARRRSGIALELHVAAARAADDVGERGAEPVGGRDQALRRPRRRRPRGAARRPVAPQAAHCIGAQLGHARAALADYGALAPMSRRVEGERELTLLSVVAPMLQRGGDASTRSTTRVATRSTACRSS